MARDATVIANREIWLALKTGATDTVADADWVKFDADERKGVESFDPVLTRTNRVQPGFTWDEERTVTGAYDGSISATFTANKLTMKLFFGTEGMHLHYRDYEDGIGTGKALVSGVAKIESVNDPIAEETVTYVPSLLLYARPVNSTQ